MQINLLSCRDLSNRVGTTSRLIKSEETYVLNSYNFTLIKHNICYNIKMKEQKDLW